MTGPIAHDDDSSVDGDADDAHDGAHDMAHDMAHDIAHDMADDQPSAEVRPGVDPALERLAALDELPVDEHLAIYEAVHRDLRAAMAAGDEDNVGRQ